MKKLFSILFAFLILLSVVHITIATHHCGSADAIFEKVSVTGELASCGMEGCDDKCSSPGNHFEEPCCDNRVSILAVNHDYTPSFTNFTAFAQYILQVYIVPVSIELNSLTTLNLTSTGVSPPTNFLIHAVSLPKICLFLI
ncbi:MAG TPA: hypothetical protein VFC67_08970 [Prolixibacteraceae bacterium]|nr:hypothetical protein [Prolixibacteraceae bacterium]